MTAPTTTAADNAIRIDGRKIVLSISTNLQMRAKNMQVCCSSMASGVAEAPRVSKRSGRLRNPARSGRLRNPARSGRLRNPARSGRLRNPARWLHFASQNAIQRVRRLVNQRLRIMWERMEILECEIIMVADFRKGLHHGRPVGRAVEQRAERFQRVISTLFGEFLQMDVLDALAEQGNPIFGKLEQHDVAGVEVDTDVFAVEAVHENIQILRT